MSVFQALTVGAFGITIFLAVLIEGVVVSRANEDLHLGPIASDDVTLDVRDGRLGLTSISLRSRRLPSVASQPGAACSATTSLNAVTEVLVFNGGKL